MTVIAGVSLFDGIMLLADCRVTWERKGKSPIYCDNAQKLFQISPYAAIGFCGDVNAANLILKEMFRQIRFLPRTDALSLSRWLPRFLRAWHGRLIKKHDLAPIHFMVGSVIPGRQNLVERARAVNLVKAILEGQGAIQRNWVPDHLMAPLFSPPVQKMIPLQGSVANVLYVMRSPDFSPEFIKPLEYAAIGSGEASVEAIKEYADWILGGPPGDLGAKLGLTDAVSQFVAEHDVRSVGGMYPCMKIDEKGVGYLGGSQRFPLYEVSLRYDPAMHRWIQKNHTTGKEVTLLHPPEVISSPANIHRTFNDMREALEHFNPARAKKADAI